MQGFARRGLRLRVERAHGAHQSFERIACNYFMTFARQAEHPQPDVKIVCGEVS